MLIAVASKNLAMLSFQRLSIPCTASTVVLQNAMYTCRMSPSVKCTVILSNRHGMRLSGQVNGSSAVGLSKSSSLKARLSSSLETANDSVTRDP